MSVLLGQGAFGTVFKEKIGGATCAVKRIKNYDREAMKEVVIPEDGAHPEAVECGASASEADRSC